MKTWDDDIPDIRLPGPGKASVIVFRVGLGFCLVSLLLCLGTYLFVRRPAESQRKEFVAELAERHVAVKKLQGKLDQFRRQREFKMPALQNRLNESKRALANARTALPKTEALLIELRNFEKKEIAKEEQAKADLQKVLDANSREMAEAKNAVELRDKEWSPDEFARVQREVAEKEAQLRAAEKRLSGTPPKAID